MVNYHSGLGENLVAGEDSGKIERIFRGINIEDIEDQFMAKVVDALRFIEEKTGNNRLDIEFAYKKGQLYVLQKRPITVNDNCIS